MVVAVLLSLAALLGACSPEQQNGQPSEKAASKSYSGGHGSSSATGQGSATKTDQKQEALPALVPIAHLTYRQESVSMEELAGRGDLAVPKKYAGTAGRLLGGSGFQMLGSTAEVVDRVSRTPEAMGLVPWDEVDTRVKALGVDDESIFEPGQTVEDYPLAPDGMTMPDGEKLRRVVVGGDIVLDRGQYYTVIQQGLGLDFPLDGGYAAITGRTAEPSYYSETGTIHQFTAERRGSAGKVRDYLSGADLTIANFENPVVRNSEYHPSATTFTGDLRLMPELDQAGIDGVTLGNNHILDAGTSGLRETIRHLDDAGISHAGAGMNLDEARQPMIFDLGGTKIGVLSYHGVPSYDWTWATNRYPGTAPLLEKVMKEDVERLKKKVDVVMVMPHWGVEYTATPEPDQVSFAHAAVDAGADVFIGGHAHWPKGIEMYDGTPIYYGVGNFLLDQSWSEETSTGIFAEITLYGDRVIQTQPIPFIMLDRAQPNILVPNAGGNRALRKVYSASLGPEFQAYKASD